MTTALPAQHPAAPARDLPAGGLPSAETVAWFMVHGKVTEQEAAGLARAELAARRGGYAVRWDYPWMCTLADAADTDVALGYSLLHLDGSPVADPRARQAERDLLHAAGLDLPGSFGPVPGAASNGYALSWEIFPTCQLFDPAGTLAGEDDSTVFDPGTDPAATPQGRVIAAQLAERIICRPAGKAAS